MSTRSIGSTPARASPAAAAGESASDAGACARATDVGAGAAEAIGKRGAATLSTTELLAGVPVGTPPTDIPDAGTTRWATLTRSAGWGAAIGAALGDALGDGLGAERDCTAFAGTRTNRWATPGADSGPDSVADSGADSGAACWGCTGDEPFACGAWTAERTPTLPSVVDGTLASEARFVPARPRCAAMLVAAAFALAAFTALVRGAISRSRSSFTAIA
jgi:hypothetical protein